MPKEQQMIIEDSRYDRQVRLWGKEGQAKLEGSRVVVVGLGPQGVYTSLCLAALGAGNIVLVDGDDSKKDEMFLDMKVPKGVRGEVYPELLSRVNTQINIEGYGTNLETTIDHLLLRNADVVIDSTNSIRSKKMAFLFGKKEGIPVISTSSKRGYTKTMFCRTDSEKPEEYLMPMFEGMEQDELLALLKCGIVAEEARKAIFKEAKDYLKEPVRYALSSYSRLAFPEIGEEMPVPDLKIYSKLKAAFLGGGALGCWGAIPISKMGFARVDVFDYDAFDSTNINRQVLAYDGIGKLKSVHVASKIEKMSRGKTRSKGYNMLITPGFDTEEKYDVVFDFVDNMYTRAINTAYAIIHGIPLISAGALPFSARWNIQADGKTQCQDCLFEIYKAGMKEEMIRRASCATEPNPSVVMSNAIGGVAPILDVLSLFEPEKYGEPFNGQQIYRHDMKTRLGNIPLNSPCSCYSQTPPSMEISEKDVEAFMKGEKERIAAIGSREGRASAEEQASPE